MGVEAMSIDWNSYEIYDPGVVGLLDSLPRSTARQAFDQLMAAKPARIEMLRSLVRANGVVLGTTDTAVQDLNDWFRANVEPDRNKPGRLLPEWYSVVNDISLFLGDLMIARCPGLRWEFYIWGKKDVSYQRHVIMGFTDSPNPKVNVDIDRWLATYAHRIVASRGSIPHYGSATVRGVEIDIDAASASMPEREIEKDAFLSWLRNVEQRC